MIIGRGSIASMLNDREGVCFFASGVSDSSMEKYDNFQNPESQREHKLFFEQAKTANERGWMFVYFSTISKFLQATPYTMHKNTMEFCIRDFCDNYTIIRLGNVWECTNPNTFINRMKYWDRNDKYVVIRDEYKYMISKEQLNFVTDNLPLKGKHEISIFGEMLKVKECLNR